MNVEVRDAQGRYIAHYMDVAHIDGFKQQNQICVYDEARRGHVQPLGAVLTVTMPIRMNGDESETN